MKTSRLLTTLKSTLASVAVHMIFLAIGSFVVYQNSINTLELTGNPGGGGPISLSGFSSAVKKNGSQKRSNALSNVNRSKMSPDTSAKSSVSTAVSSSFLATQSGHRDGVETTGTSTASSGGVEKIDENGSEVGDADHGYLFSEIKSFFENRLGSTLAIREIQLIKIKVLLNSNGEVQDAFLAHGKLEGSLLRRVLSVAKNIPFRRFWKSGSFPKELIFPIVLTPQ